MNPRARAQVWSRADVIPLQLAIEGSAADAEHLAGNHFIPIHLLKYT